MWVLCSVMVVLSNSGWPALTRIGRFTGELEDDWLESTILTESRRLVAGDLLDRIQDRRYDPSDIWRGGGPLIDWRKVSGDSWSTSSSPISEALPTCDPATRSPCPLPPHCATLDHRGSPSWATSHLPSPAPRSRVRLASRSWSCSRRANPYSKLRTRSAFQPRTFGRRRASSTR